MSNNYLLNLLACGLILSSPICAAGSKDKTSPVRKTADTKVEAKNGWKAFSSTESNFTIEFPTEPQIVEQKIDIPKTNLSITYQTYLSEPSENVVYVVSVWTYPPEIDMSKPDVNLQDGFSGMLSALPGSEVLNMEMMTFEESDALEFLVKSEDIFFQGRLLLANNKLYQVFIVYKGSEEKNVDYKKFINSFHYLEKTEKQQVKVPTTKARKLKV